MSLTRITGPATEPVTLTQAKAHLRVDTDDDDTLIEALIAAARDYVEQWTGIALVSQAWRLTLDTFPADEDFISLPMVPLLTVTSVTYLDASGVSQTLALTTGYLVDTASYPGRIYLPYSVTWPTTYAQRNAVTVNFTAGYASVPPSLTAAMLLRIGDLYENREASIVGTIHTENPAVLSLMAPYRRWAAGIA